jgi:methyl-accepting chemotaxis protein
MAQSSNRGRANKLSHPTPDAAVTPGRLYRRTAWFTTAGALAVIGIAGLLSTRQIESALAGAPEAQVSEVQGIVVRFAVASAALIVAGMFAAARALARRLARTVDTLTRVAEAVAVGDLSVDFVPSTSRGAYGRLSRGIAGMLAELRRLTGTIADSATQTAVMAAEITTGADQMSASASEIATTSSVLSEQATDMAQTLQEVHGDAARLLGIAGELSAGAREGVERNASLRALADANRARLDASAAALATLASEVASSAAAVEGVAAASEEIRAFVTLVQKMARQSKLLALNAAMEAARAGEHGAGFAVVASEVRRLAASSSDAAERTVTVVNQVLARVAESRASSAQTVHTVDAVLEASREGARTFGEVSAALEVAEQWTTSIADAAIRSDALVAAMTRQLDTLAHGTESFAAAMQEVAASSQEQSASTHEIATAAAGLTTHAARLSELAGVFEAQGPAAAVEGPGPRAPLAPAPGGGRYSAPSATQPMRPSGVRTAA